MSIISVFFNVSLRFLLVGWFSSLQVFDQWDILKKYWRELRSLWLLRNERKRKEGNSRLKPNLFLCPQASSLFLHFLSSQTDCWAFCVITKPLVCSLFPVHCDWYASNVDGIRMVSHFIPLSQFCPAIFEVLSNSFCALFLQLISWAFYDYLCGFCFNY